MSCTNYPYLRGGCEEVEAVSPTKHNFSTYSSTPTFVYTNDQMYASVGDDGIAELIGISGDILRKVDEIELIMISTSIDQRILMNDYVKETCPALEQINYTCPNLICPSGLKYTVEFDVNYVPAVVVALGYLLWRAVRNGKPAY